MTTGATVGPPLPAWEPDARARIAHAANATRLLGSLTPRNLASELDELCRAWRRGEERAPRFRYRRNEPGAGLRRELSQGAALWAGRGVLGQRYAERAQELLLELKLTAETSPREFARLAARRFGERDRFDDEADEISATWLDDGPGEALPADAVSDDRSDPRSLLSLLQAEANRQRLAVEIRPVAGLAALAAAGPSVIYVVAGRRIAPTDAARTVLHEIHGHALPGARGQSARLGLFEVGTAYGMDDQEGRALLLEDDAGLLDQRRRFELGLRHTAARAAAAGASFVETARGLARYPTPLFDRLRITCRVHRGGGLARERIYLPAYLRVCAARAADPTVDQVMSRGAIAVPAVHELRTWAT